MKKTAVLLLFVALGTSLFSCKKIIKSVFPGFETSIPEIGFPLPAIPVALPNEVDLGTFDQSFNLDDTIKTHTGGLFNQNDISSIKLSKIVFTIVNADDLNNQANFESARFTLHSNYKKEPQELASLVFPDAYANTFTFVPANPPELKEYLKGNVLTYHIYGKLRRPTTKTLNLKVLATIVVQ